MSKLFLSSVNGYWALNPVGNFKAAVIPAKFTTPSYCNTTARVDNPSFVSTSNFVFGGRELAARNVLFAEVPTSTPRDVSGAVQ